MREIKFRGISKSTNEWIYGYLIIEPNGRAWIGKSVRTISEAKPETVGQFTCLKFNGIDLYEGDIIEWYQRPEGYPQDPNKARKTHVIQIKNIIAGCFLFNFYDYKIIGNIHQNPELL